MTDEFIRRKDGSIFARPMFYRPIMQNATSPTRCGSVTGVIAVPFFSLAFATLALGRIALIEMGCLANVKWELLPVSRRRSRSSDQPTIQAAQHHGLVVHETRVRIDQ
jgi:hypothetical protein